VALDDAGLLSDFNDLLDGTTPYGATHAAAGTNWSNVVGAYSLTGTANAVPAVEVGGARATLASSLGTAFATPGTMATLATAVRNALDTYWVTGITFAGAIAPPTPTGSAVFEAAVAAINEPTHAGAALAFRDAVAAYTKLVQVTFPGPTTFFVV
jgi:hypothetical protein